ncbi:MAG: hypothetical protein KKH02_00245 [Proteobacteria bacterium]|nr:hypothetical protein [Pseudomonadota bacterium]MBU4580846.1 hypothetical protein [Pseudomonadota bacterium]MCG2739641.1 hypothetical protein [Syntrophaceae bacterium]
MQKGVEIEEHDLLKNPLSNEEILTLVTTKDGQMRTPIITRGDEVIVFGYNRDKLGKLFP